MTVVALYTLAWSSLSMHIFPLKVFISLFFTCMLCIPCRINNSKKKKIRSKRESYCKYSYNPSCIRQLLYIIVYWKHVCVRSSYLVSSFIFFCILDLANTSYQYRFSCICSLKCMNTFVSTSIILFFPIRHIIQ
jgi:hypothetical protein